MIRTRASIRRRRFDDVQTAHLLLTFGDPPSRGEVARVTQRTRHARKKIRVERENAFGFAEVVDGLYILPEGHDCAGARIVAIDGFVLMPLGLRKLGED